MAKKLKHENIPARFYAGSPRPRVTNVAELKQQLEHLPDALPVLGDFGGQVEMVVFNYGDPDCHLAFREADDDEDEDDDDGEFDDHDETEPPNPDDQFPG